MPEIERKFLVTALPAGLGEGDAIAQGYLAIATDGVETRIRRRAGAATLTVKSGPAMVRVEEEIPIEPERFDALWPLTEGRRVEKVRHLVALEGGLTAEVDVYAGPLDGLLTAEIEFPSETAARTFSWRCSGPLQDDHRDRPAGLLLVAVVRRPVGGHLPPHRRLLLVGRNARAGAEDLVADLELDVGRPAEVLEPLRVVGRAAVRGHEQVVVAAAPVDQRHRARLARFRARRRQQEGRRAAPEVPELATGLAITRDVRVAVELACVFLSHATGVAGAGSGQCVTQPTQCGQTVHRASSRFVSQ
jgi:adenylate cyclase